MAPAPVFMPASETDCKVRPAAEDQPRAEILVRSSHS